MNAIEDAWIRYVENVMRQHPQLRDVDLKYMKPVFFSGIGWMIAALRSMDGLDAYAFMDRVDREIHEFANVPLPEKPGWVTMDGKAN